MEFRVVVYKPIYVDGEITAFFRNKQLVEVINTSDYFTPSASKFTLGITPEEVEQLLTTVTNTQWQVVGYCIVSHKEFETLGWLLRHGLLKQAFSH